jgi:glycosyltransferase involved in cell wall biosynthesis
MIDAPQVSVIIPAYNSSGTLSRALESVFAQTFGSYEVIVVDDGSTDDFEGAIIPYAGRITVVRQQNAGAATARNTGAAAARGELLAFLDADDFWHKRKLELQVEAFRQIPDLALCWTDFRWLRQSEVSGSDSASVIPAVVQPVITRFESVFASPYLGTPGVMLRKRVFDELGGFRSDLASAEDVDLWLRSAYGRTIARLPCQLFFVVRSPGSITAVRMEGTYEDNLRVIGDFCRANPSFASSSSAVIAKARAKVWENWGSALLVKNDPHAARQCLQTSLANRPSSRALYLFMKSMLKSGMQRAVKSAA